MKRRRKKKKKVEKTNTPSFSRGQEKFGKCFFCKLSR
jgi:hypothetical protein